MWDGEKNWGQEMIERGRNGVSVVSEEFLRSAFFQIKVACLDSMRCQEPTESSKQPNNQTKLVI